MLGYFENVFHESGPPYCNVGANSRRTASQNPFPSLQKIPCKSLVPAEASRGLRNLKQKTRAAARQRLQGRIEAPEVTESG